MPSPRQHTRCGSLPGQHSRTRAWPRRDCELNPALMHEADPSRARLRPRTPIVGATMKRSMKVQPRDFLLLVTLVTAAATPALGQTTAPAVTPTDTGTPSGASIPDFSGLWNHASLNGLEPPLSGPGPARNRSPLRTG